MTLTYQDDPDPHDRSWPHVPAVPPVNLLLVSGSLRVGSTNAAVLQTAAELAPEGVQA